MGLEVVKSCSYGDISESPVETLFSALEVIFIMRCAILFFFTLFLLQDYHLT